MIASPDISRPSARHPSSYVVLLEARDLPPRRHTHCSICGTEPVVCGGSFGAISALTKSCLFCGDFGSPIRLPIALIEQTVDARQKPASTDLRERRWKNWGKPLASHAYQSKHPDEPLRLKETRAKWNTRNWRRKAGTNYRSNTLHLRPGRKLTVERLSPYGRCGRRPAASRNQRNWFAAIVGAMTWRRVSSSGAIADAAGVLVNAMGRRHRQGKRRSRNSLVREVR